jgi:cyclophilin family peptidyl-prolyl cis-trans isomerase
MRSKISLAVISLRLWPPRSPPASRAPTTTIPRRANSRSSRRPRGSPAAAADAKIETTLGTFTVRALREAAPITVANFVGSARGTRPWKDPKTGKWVEKKPFYDGLIFHRVIPGFMVQGGDPLGVGTGNPGYRFEDEFSPNLQVRQARAAAMANAGPARTARSSSSPRGRPSTSRGATPSSACASPRRWSPRSPA